MKKLKVLVSAYACHPPTSAGCTDEENILGSGESLLGWNLVKQISRFHKVWIITQRRNRRGIERAISSGAMAGVKFYYVDLPLWHRSLWYNQITLHIYYYIWQILAFFAAKKLHKEFKFDVAHHVTYANYWMPSFIGALLSIPFIWGPVGGGQKTSKGFLREYSVPGRLIDLTRASVQQFVSCDYFRRRCLRRAKAILVCNQETANKFGKKFNKKIYFFPVNGVSIEDFGIESGYHNVDKHFTVFTTGRLVHWKNFASAIKAFNFFSDKYPKSTFLIIGEGPERQRLEQLTNNLNLQDKVHFVPWLPRDEMLLRMRSCDVFLYPSLREGGGAVVVEAMASGKPVVCLDTAGPGFHIREEWGIKIAPRDPEYVVNAMAKALERLYLDKDLRITMGKAARKRAEEFYLWDRLGEKMQEIYEESLKC